MATFNAETYDARVDSTEGKGKTDLLVINYEEGNEKGEGRTCQSGTGRPVSGKKASFAPGGDMQLRGKLTRAHLAGVKVEVNGKTQTALAVAKDHSLDHHLVAAKEKFDARQAEKAQRAEKREAEAKAWSEKKAKEEAAKAKAKEQADKAKAAKAAKERDEAVAKAEKEAAKS